MEDKLAAHQLLMAEYEVNLAEEVALENFGKNNGHHITSSPAEPGSSKHKVYAAELERILEDRKALEWRLMFTAPAAASV